MRRHPEKPSYMEASDGRLIAYRDMGPPDGVPNILHHGSPGSSKAPHLSEEDLYRLGTRVIAYARPGYDGTERLEGYNVADLVPYVEELVDALGISRFAVLGRSGGTALAMGCAALLPDRVTALALMASVVPPEAEVDLLDSTTQDNNEKWQMAQSNPDQFVADISQRARELRTNLRSHMRRLEPDLTPADYCGRLAMNAIGYDTRWCERGVPLDDIAFGHGAGIGEGYGWADDAIAVIKPWGFDIAAVQAPTFIWHGAKDPFISVDKARWLSERIPNAHLQIQSEGSHLDSILYAPDAFDFLRRHTLGEQREKLLELLVEQYMAKLQESFRDMLAPDAWPIPHFWRSISVRYGDIIGTIWAKSDEQLAQSYPDLWPKACKKELTAQGISPDDSRREGEMVGGMPDDIPCYDLEK